jgi:S-DNA-T family DNA segregation ATPase FtsK/SpoIIIE
MLLRSAGGVPSPASRMIKPESLPEQEECDPATSQTGEKTSQEVLDELYLLTAHLVVKSKKASISWLQRQLRIGYIDAAELMEKMEADGIVSPPDRIGRREVLVGIQDLPELPE